MSVCARRSGGSSRSRNSNPIQQQSWRKSVQEAEEPRFDTTLSPRQSLRQVVRLLLAWTQFKNRSFSFPIRPRSLLCLSVRDQLIPRRSVGVLCATKLYSTMNCIEYCFQAIISVQVKFFPRSQSRPRKERADRAVPKFIQGNFNITC